MNRATCGFSRLRARGLPFLLIVDPVIRFCTGATCVRRELGGRLCEPARTALCEESQPVHQAPPPHLISPAAVFVFTTNDVEGKANPCTAQVDRAWQLATRSLQVVVTTYWLDNQNDGVVDKYCVAQDMIEKGKKVH